MFRYTTHTSIFKNPEKPETGSRSISIDTSNFKLIIHCKNDFDLMRMYRRLPGLLQAYFLLEVDMDYRYERFRSISTLEFNLSVEFTSACGQYALYRLKDGTAPEALNKIIQG